MAVLFFSLSLSMFHSKFPLASTRSIIGQSMFLVFFAAFSNAVFGGGLSLIPGEEIKYGGIIGYQVYTFFNENLFFNTTPVFLFAMMVIAVPLALAMTISDFLDKLGRALQWLFSGISSLKPKSKEALVQNKMTVDPDTNNTAATFGDFRKNDKSMVDVPVVNINADPKTVSDVSDKKIKQPNVNIKEESVEGAYVNSELQYPHWKLPGLDLLNDFKKEEPSHENIKKNADIIEQTLRSFGIKASVVDVLIGPSVTQYALDIALGTKVSKIANLSNDLALALATSSNAVRIEAPIPGTSYVGIEIPNEKRETVYLKEAIGAEAMKKNDYLLPMAVGKDIAGKLMAFDMQKMPHILIAGATGSGKSILTNGFIISLLMGKTPDEVKFIMVDPKQVELSDYNGIPHLLTPVITEMDKVLNALKWAINEMESRYTIFREEKVRNIESYNEKMGFAALPYIIIVIDEMADMMMSTNKVETEAAIVRLAQKARATGLHLVLATQRPSVDVITGLIKANIPGRIGMSVTTQIDSRVILDHIGAEALLGRGDMLFKDPAKNKATRLQGMWVSPEEIQRVVKFIKEQVPEVHYNKEVTEKHADPNAPESAGGDFSDDNQFANAVRVIVNAQKGSASLLQRKLSLGYNRAARLLDELEEHGVVGPPNGSKPRDVLISDAEGFLASRSGDQTTGEEE